MGLPILTIRAVLTGMLFLASVGGDGTFCQSDFDELTGEWIVVSYLRGGRPVENLYFDTVVFADERVMYYGRRGIDEGQYRINPKTDPKQFDLIVEQQERTRVARGIYRFEGKVLVICHSPFGQPRPTSFESTEDGQGVLIVLERRPRNGKS